jgi:predicted RNase H-like nuclease (RuvC/YqgF family)
MAEALGFGGILTQPWYQKEDSPCLEADREIARIPHLPKFMIAKLQKEIKGALDPHIPTQGKLRQETQKPKEGEDLERATTGVQRRERTGMASSSNRPMSTEERLKQMETTLANLQQMLEHQLDFLENLDVEAGRRLEQLESDITMTKIGFAQELDKLNQELKSPQQGFDERMEELEAKMAQLNSNWNNEDPK